MNITVEYDPTAKQRMFHASKADEVLFGGAAGGGKSKAIVMDAFFRCLKYPNTHAFIFRRTFRELEDSVMKEARESYPPALVKFNSGAHECRLRNGSVIHFRHCENEADVYTYRSTEFHWLYIDELTTFTESMYLYLLTRVRAAKKLGIRPIKRAASNPGGIGHGWVKKRFVDAGPYMQLIEHEVVSSVLKDVTITRTQYIPSLATENPHISTDYIRSLELLPEAISRALLHGDWNAFEGQVFVEFADKPVHYHDRKFTHVIAPFDIPLTWPRYMSFDHGYSRPFSVGWWAIGPRGEAYRYREWYGCEPGRANEGIKISARQIAQGIIEREKEREAADNIPVYRVADPAIFDRSRGDSIAQQMEPTSGGLTGVIFHRGDNTRLAGKMQLHERLRFDAEGRPMLYVFNTCKDWIRTVPALPYDTSKPEDVDSDAEDHAYDETRYFLMARPTPTVAREVVRVPAFDPYSDNRQKG